MEQKFICVILVFCLTSGHCGLVNWFQEWSESLNPRIFLSSRNKRDAIERDIHTVDTPAQSREDENLEECEEGDENNNEQIVTLFDIEHENNRNTGKHAEEKKKHNKRCNSLGMAAPAGIEDFHRVDDGPRAEKLRLPRAKSSECQNCRQNPVCKLLKECTKCNEMCTDNQVVGAINPSLTSRFAKVGDGGSTSIMYPFANFSSGAEKELICRVFGLKSKEIDTIFIYVSTKSNNPPKKHNLHTKNDSEESESSRTPSMKPRFGEDYDYDNLQPLLPKNIVHSQSRKNPDVIEGPPPRVGTESSLIVEPEGLDNSNSDESEQPENISENTKSSPEVTERSSSSNRGLPVLEEMNKKHEQHLSDISQALREAKEMIKNIQEHAKIQTQPVNTVGANNPVDAANNNNLLDNIQKSVPPKMVENLKKVNEFLLDRAQDTLDMIHNVNNENQQKSGIVGNSIAPEDSNNENVKETDHSAATKNIIKDFKKFPQFIVSQMRDTTNNAASQDPSHVDDGIVSQTENPKQATEISTKPSKNVLKAKVENYLKTLKKNKQIKVSTDNNKIDLSTTESVIPKFESRNNIVNSQQTHAPRLEITAKPPSDTKPLQLMPTVEEKLKKDRELFKEKLSKYVKEQKLKNEKKAATRKNTAQRVEDANDINNDPILEKKVINLLPNKNEMTTENSKDIVKVQLNPTNTENQNLVNDNIANTDNNANNLLPDLEKVKKHTDAMKEKLRMFLGTNQDKLKETVSNPLSEIQKNPNKKENVFKNIEPKRSNLESKTNDILGDTAPKKIENKDISNENVNLLASRQLELQNAVKKMETDIQKRLRETNEELMKNLKPKPVKIPTLPTPSVPPLKKIELLSPTQRISNEEKREKLRAKLKEYANSLHIKAPKFASLENNAAEKYGKNLLNALKESEQKLKTNMFLNNRLNALDNLKSKAPDAAMSNKNKEETNPSVGEPNPDSCPVDPPEVNLGSRANFKEEESSTPWSNNLGKIVKSPKNDLFFVGDGIKLPLRMATKEDGTLDLSVDLDKLCSCRNSCPKNPTEIEETVGVIMEKEAQLQKELNSSAKFKRSLMNSYASTKAAEKRKRSLQVKGKTINKITSESKEINNSVKFKRSLKNTSENIKNARKLKRSLKVKEKAPDDNSAITQNYEELNKNAKSKKQHVANTKPTTRRKRSLKEHPLNENLHTKSYSQENNESAITNDIIKTTGVDFISHLKNGKDSLRKFNKKLNEDLKLKLNNLLDDTPEENNLVNDLEGTANKVKTNLSKEKKFITKFHNKLRKDGKDLEAKLDNVLDDAQESVLDPFYIMEKKLATLNNEIKKEHEKHDAMLAEESKRWVGDKDFNDAVNDEVNILENIFNWFKKLPSELDFF